MNSLYSLKMLGYFYPAWGRKRCVDISASNAMLAVKHRNIAVKVHNLQEKANAGPG